MIPVSSAIAITAASGLKHRAVILLLNELIYLTICDLLVSYIVSDRAAA